MANETQKSGAAQGAAPASIEDATAQIAGLQAANDSLSKDVDASKKSAAALAGTVAQHEQTIAQLKASGDQKDADLKDAGDVITDLKAQLAAATTKAANVSARPTIKIGNVTYDVKSGAMGHFGKFTAGELAKNPAAAAAILAIKGQNILVPITQNK